MTLYEKPQTNIFAQNAPDSEIKPFEAWARGLGIAFDETNGLPEMEGLNGLFNLLNQYIKYLEQNGLAEWSSDLEYPIGAGVRVGLNWYRAKRQNLNKNPTTSQNDWSVFFNASDVSYTSPLLMKNGTLSILDATTTQKGVARFATQNEITNKSNVSASIKPSDIPNFFKATENLIELPNGTKFYFNTAMVNGDSNATIKVPINVIHAQATLNSSNFNAEDDAGCGVTWSGNNITLRNGISYQISIAYFAIGS